MICNGDIIQNLKDAGCDKYLIQKTANGSEKSKRHF
jgi:hypothetical protein